MSQEQAFPGAGGFGKQCSPKSTDATCELGAVRPVESFGDQSTPKAESLKDQITQTARDAGHQAKDAAQHAIHDVKEKAVEAVDDLKSRGASMAAQRKDWLAHEVERVGAAIRKASESFSGDDDQRMAGYTRFCAERVEEGSRYLKGKEIGELIDDVEGFVRRRPEVVLGGMFLGGLILGRFLKASRPARQQRDLAIPATSPADDDFYKDFDADDESDEFYGDRGYGARDYGGRRETYDRFRSEDRYGSRARRTGDRDRFDDREYDDRRYRDVPASSGEGNRAGEGPVAGLGESSSFGGAPSVGASFTAGSLVGGGAALDTEQNLFARPDADTSDSEYFPPANPR